MRAIKLGVISSHNLKGKLLFAIDERWKDFLMGDPTFEVVIKDGKLNLYGPKLNLNPHRDYPTAETGDNHE